MKKTLSQLAFEAILFEVSCPYKPGLVCPHDNGSHTDMTYQTFVDSAIALYPFFDIYYTLGKTYSLDLLFNELRKTGILAERAMFQATNHVNTHKGLNFIFSILLGALGHCHKNKRPISHLQDVIIQLSQPLALDFDLIHQKTSLSHGEKLFLNYGIKGIRQQALDGFPELFTVALPCLSTHQVLSNKVCLQALFELMSTLQDTTIVHRTGVEGLEHVQALAKEFLLSNSFLDQLPLANLKSLNEYFKAHRYSPGGSADLLSAAIFLTLLKRDCNGLS